MQLSQLSRAPSACVRQHGAVPRAPAVACMRAGQGMKSVWARAPVHARAAATEQQTKEKQFGVFRLSYDISNVSGSNGIALEDGGGKFVQIHSHHHACWSP